MAPIDWTSLFVEGFVGLFWSITTAVIGILIERRFRITHLFEKLYNRNNPCNFDFACDLEGDNKKIKATLESVLKNRDYKVSYDEKGKYRTLISATKEDLGALKFRILDEDPLHLSLDSPIQAIVSSVPKRLSEITAILQDVKDQSQAIVESASLEVALPYNITNKIKEPKGMTVKDYRVELLNDKKVRVILTLNNRLSISSVNFIDLTEAYRSII
jgi:hypothetical protein